MEAMLRYDPAQRPTAAQALQFPYFQVGLGLLPGIGAPPPPEPDDEEEEAKSVDKPATALAAAVKQPAASGVESKAVVVKDSHGSEPARREAKQNAEPALPPVTRLRARYYPSPERPAAQAPPAAAPPRATTLPVLSQQQQDRMRPGAAHRGRDDGKSAASGALESSTVPHLPQLPQVAKRRYWH